jgi:hypothetical protein
LTRDMVGIGMNFAAEPNADPPIEETLVHASSLGMDGDDLRVLSVLTTWLGIHSPHINADRLVRCLSEHPSERVKAYWAAVSHWLGKDRRFTRLGKLHGGPALDLLPVGTEFQIARRGEDERFASSVLRIPAGTLRDRTADVLSPESLVRQHRGYRNRVRMGPTWRADVWTVLERALELGVAEVARRAGCSFATAWQVVRDFSLLRASKRTATSSSCADTRPGTAASATTGSADAPGPSRVSRPEGSARQGLGGALAGGSPRGELRQDREQGASSEAPVEAASPRLEPPPSHELLCARCHASKTTQRYVMESIKRSVYQWIW